MPTYQNKPKRVKVILLIIILKTRQMKAVDCDDSDDVDAIKAVEALLQGNDMESILQTPSNELTTPQSDVLMQVDAIYSSVSDGCSTGSLTSDTSTLATLLSEV